MHLHSEEFKAALLGLSVSEFRAFNEELWRLFLDEKNSRLSVCFAIYRFYKAIGKRKKGSFLSYCNEAFHLERTQVMRSVQIVEEFANEKKDALAEEYQDFSLSLLAELLTIPKNERHKVTSTWTVRNVRELRQILERSESAEDENEELEKPPDKYVRFKKWKRADLCDKILALEKELKVFKEVSFEKKEEN